MQGRIARRILMVLVLRVNPHWLCGLLIALAPFPGGVQARPASSFDEVGHFYVQSFGPEDYDAHAQNWAIAQGPDGLLYVANGDGVTRRWACADPSTAWRATGAASTRPPAWGSPGWSRPQAPYRASCRFPASPGRAGRCCRRLRASWPDAPAAPSTSSTGS